MRRGFTLVELLVAIAIIAILSSIVVAGLNTARGDARDKQRLAAVEQARLSIEIYREAYGEYPDVGCSRSTTQWTGNGSNYGDCEEYIEGLDNILQLPTDPTDDTYGYIYRTNADFSEYKFMAYNVVETETLAKGDDYARYPDSCGGSMTSADQISYAVYSAGAECW